MEVARRHAPRGNLFINPSGVTIVAHGLNNEPHRHFTASVTIGLDAPVRFRVGRAAPWQEAAAVLTAPNASFQLTGGDGCVLNLQIDPESDAYARLASRWWPTGRPSIVVLDDELGALLRAAAPLAERAHGGALWNHVLSVLGAANAAPRTFDPRIARVLDYLKATIDAAPSLAEVAAHAGLSEGRTGHLFAEQVGVPLTRYILWLRVREVVFATAFGASLTDAAHDAGFSDSPHFTRSFQSMFGVAPSQILRSQNFAMTVDTGAFASGGPHAQQDATRFQARVRGRAWRARR